MSTEATAMSDAAPPESQTVRSYRLLRTGDQAVAFEGSLIAEAAGVQINGRDRDRGHDVRVYQTTGGTYIAEVVYWSTWKGEAEARSIQVAGRELSRLAAVLKAYDPLGYVLGYPPADRFRERQERLHARLRADYATRVSDVLAQLPDAVERVK